MPHLLGLNEKQKEAVLQKDGPILIIAGAGAGKTKTIAHRILHLIKEGTSPENILAITFTNKAAKEMRERVEKIISSDKKLNFPMKYYSKPFISTFHSLGVHIIKENSRLIGLTRNFSIMDRSDSSKLVKECLKSLDIDSKQFEPSKILNIISREKGDLNTVENYSVGVEDGYTLKSVAAKGSNVKQFEELLRAEFESKWEAIRKRRGTSQTSLFHLGPSDGLNLPSD